MNPEKNNPAPPIAAIRSSAMTVDVRPVDCAGCRGSGWGCSESAVTAAASGSSDMEIRSLCVVTVRGEGSV
jgi:hypothetical protein